MPNSISRLTATPLRCIGPSRGGRVIAVAGDPTNPAIYYFGAVAGGVWKTTDAGTTWRNVSDGYFQTASVSDIAVAPSAPNVIYVGMGESTIRTDVSYGDGVYKSTDSGRTWRHLGLTDTRHMGKVRVHPRNPDIVYVAALGHAFGPNPERGLYRSRDGGGSWEQILFVSPQAGAIDLTIDAQNPDVLYAAFWQVYRNFWELSSGGPGSGLWKSTDGGDSWTEISRNKGLPQDQLLGKIGVSASPAQGGRVWALIEAKEDQGAGLYRSDDFGDSWQLVNDEAKLRYRPWYYMHVFADPQDAERVYVLNLDMHRSDDGGKNFTQISTPHGDNHGLWINPGNNQFLVQGNDGGACISFDGGDSFSTVYNQLTGQFYHLDTDDHFPYRVYGTQQDNTSLRIPSDTTSGGISWGDCQVAGTGESGYIAVDPRDSDIVYVGAMGSSPGGLGSLQRADLRSQQIRLINIWPESYGGDIPPTAFKYRFPWTFPILFSPHDPGVLYACGNHVFRTQDEGNSWELLSPDLTTNDHTKLIASGGPITLDTSGAEHYCTISTFRESAHEAGVFWAGSDDGLVHISRDGGASWQNVTPPQLPELTLIACLEPSPHEPATCYLAGTRYKLDDPAPYLFKTTDYGQSWQSITSDLPENDYTRVIRCDPEVPGLLYLGTERGLAVSLDDGASWHGWAGNFPVTPVYDLQVKDAALVVATHGRSFWILDDLTPLRQAASGRFNGNAHLFPPCPAYRVHPDLFADWLPSEGKVYGMGSTVTYLAGKDETGAITRTFLDGGEGAAKGATLTYYLPEALPPETPLVLTILDGVGDTLQEFTVQPAGWQKWPEAEQDLAPGPWLSAQAGLQRFVWDLRGQGALKVKGNKTAGGANKGPFCLPGVYGVVLRIGDRPLVSSLTILPDPRAAVSQEDLSAQFDLLLKIRDKISAAHAGVITLRDVREQVTGWQQRAGKQIDVQRAATAILDKLAAIEDQLIQPGDQKNTYSLTNRPRLNSALADLIPIVGSADGPPTRQAQELSAETSALVDQQLSALQEILDGDLEELNSLIQEANLPPVAV